MQRPIRVLIAKPGLDGHDRGAKVVARALRDAGFEVIYTGLHQTPEMVVTSALQEDVDVVGLSILSGAHLPIVEAIRKMMKEKKLNKPIFVGGIIPDADAKKLRKSGVAAVFGPGTSLDSIVREVREVSVYKNPMQELVAAVKAKNAAPKKTLPIKKRKKQDRKAGPKSGAKERASSGGNVPPQGRKERKK